LAKKVITVFIIALYIHDITSLATRFVASLNLVHSHVICNRVSTYLTYSDRPVKGASDRSDFNQIV